MKWKITKYEQELENCRKSHQIEMDNAKKKFDQSLNQEKEELKRLAMEYNAKDEAWKKEKMVGRNFRVWVTSYQRVPR